MAPFGYLFVVAMLAAGVHIAKYTELSPIDELRHLDYTMRAAKLGWPNLGDQLTQPAMKEEACRGLDFPFRDPPCNTKQFDPGAFRDNGYQTATAHPITYYLGAGLFSRTAVAFGISDTFLDPARVFSALLLAAGLMMAYAAGLMLGVRGPPLLAALTLVPVMPAVLHAASTVNPDSSAILVGAIVMLVGVAWERRRIPMWTLAVAGAISTGVKFTSLLSVFVIAGIFLVRTRPIEFWRERRAARSAATEAETESETEPDASMPDATAPEVVSAVAVETNGMLTDTILNAPDVEIPPRSRRDYLMAALLMVGTAVAVAAVWAALDRVRATIAPIEVPQNQLLASHGVPPLDTLFSPIQVFAWLPPWNGYDPIRFVTPYVLDVRTLMTYLFAGAMLVAALRVNRRDTISMYALFGVVASFLGAPAFVAVTVVISKVLVNPEARYGMSLIPFMAAVLASFVKGRIGTLLLWFFALLSFTIVVGSMVVSSPA